MSFSSIATYPLSRRTPRHYRLKTKRPTHNPFLESVVDNYYYMSQIHPDDMYPTEWDEDTVGYGNTSNNDSPFPIQFSGAPNSGIRVPSYDLHTSSYTPHDPLNNPTDSINNPQMVHSQNGAAAKAKKGEDSVFNPNFYTASGPVWTTAMTEYLLELMLDEVKNPRRPNGGVIHPSALPQITDAINAKFKTTLSVSSVKSKRARIKKEYSDFMTLKHNMTGMGWNHVLDIPQMDDQWWNNLAKAKKDLCCFRYKTLPHFDTLNQIFNGQVANGEYSTSSKGNTSPMCSQQTRTATTGGSGGMNIDLNGKPEEFPQPYSARLPLKNKPAKKQKSAGNDDMYMGVLQSLQESNNAKTRALNIKNQREAQDVPIGDGLTPTIDEAVALLCQLPDIDDYSFAQACNCLRDAKSRRLFSSIPDDNRHRLWVLYQHGKAEPALKGPPV